jgi:hypothetical protein
MASGATTDGHPEFINVELPSAGGSYAGKPIMDIETMPPGQRPDSYWEDKAKEMALAQYAAKKAELERDQKDPTWRRRREAEMEVALTGEKAQASTRGRDADVVDAITKEGEDELAARLAKIPPWFSPEDRAHATELAKQDVTKNARGKYLAYKSKALAPEPFG